MLGLEGNTLFVVRVPRTRYISGHTFKGVSKVQVGKQCQVQYVAEDDRTKITVPEISIDDLSATSIDWGISQHAKHFRNPTQWADRSDFLAQARLVEPQLVDEEYSPQFRPSLAALLLFGNREQKAKWLPKLVTGEWLGAFALTEEQAGSDAANVQMRATPSEDGSLTSPLLKST